MSDIAIKFENISKQYRLGTIGTGTLSHDLKRWWTINIRGKADPYLKIGQENILSASRLTPLASRHEDLIWALRDINLEIKQGEVLGIIGKNGAGKSTLLKILSRVTSPTTGCIKAKGRIASLLEVGTGFHPEMTGRENIFMNGSIMGMSKAEIKRKFDEIVDFAGVESFIDTPVKRYSSGMTVRLGFAIAAHLEPEILVVDEVLAVGDAEFQKKAIGKMQNVSKGHGRTVLFVSHNMTAVKSLCTRTALLNNGNLIFIGDTNDTIELYLRDNDLPKMEWISDLPKTPVYFKKLRIEGLKNSQPNLKLSLNVEIETTSKHMDCILAFDICDRLGTPILQSIPDFKVTSELKIKNFNLMIDLPPLIPDTYYISFWIGPHNTETFDHIKNIVSFEVSESPKKNWTFPFTKDHGFIIMNSYLSNEKNNSKNY
jgi:lipopolysaccharide transport system ATP-binding protein